MVGKGVKPVVEKLTADGNADLDLALHFSAENYGTVDAELSFEASGERVQLPQGTKREFPFVGDRYLGKVYVTFKAGNSAAMDVTIIKLTHNC